MSNFIEILRKTLQAYQKFILVFDKDGLFSYDEIQEYIRSSHRERTKIVTCVYILLINNLIHM